MDSKRAKIEHPPEQIDSVDDEHCGDDNEAATAAQNAESDCLGWDGWIWVEGRWYKEVDEFEIVNDKDFLQDLFDSLNKDPLGAN